MDPNGPIVELSQRVDKQRIGTCKYILHVAVLYLIVL
jgi:hypothetical protein